MVLAHHSGWENFLLVAVPVMAFAALLWLANRRAQQHLDATETARGPRPDTSEAGPSAPGRTGGGTAAAEPTGDGDPHSLADTSAPTDASFSQNRS
jgi:hypothetical protein